MTSYLFTLLFYLLFVLLMCDTLCGKVYAVGQTHLLAESVNSVELFNKKETITDVLNNDGSENGDLKKGITINEINLPFFLVSPKKNVMVAVAEAKYTKINNGGKETVNVITKYFKADTDDEWKSKVMNVEKKHWKTQLATTDSENTNEFSKVMFTIVNEEKNKIYIFLLNSKGDTINDENWCFKLIEGTVSSEKAAGKDKQITWITKNLSFQNIFKNDKFNIKDKKFVLDEASGSAFFTKDKNILFTLKCKTKNEGDGSSTNENVIFLFYVDVNKSAYELTLLDAEITGDLYSSFFQLNEEIFKVSNTDKKDESNKLMVFTDTEKIFTTTNSSVARLWNFLKNKNNFVTVTIKDQSLLLFTEEKEKDGNKNVNLWMTDGTRASCVKTIITTNCKDSFYWSVLYTNNELFALHNKYETERTTKNIYTLTHLKEELSTITNILDRWMKNSNTIKDLCENTATAVIPCLTDGLVGFLSGTDKEENGNWKDEYSFADATVIKKASGGKGRANKVQYGFTFSGSGVGAHWPVEKTSPENQLYNFTDPGFTLVATVIFNNNEEINVPNSVLGVNMKINKQVGLWCNKEKKWTIKVNGVETLKENGEECVQGKMYSVAVVLREAKNLEIYINWKKIIGLNDEAIQIEKEDNIKYFYFGVDSDKENEAAAVSYVTVKNIMLYNKPFTVDKILELQKKQNERQLPKPTNDGIKDSQQSNGDDDSGSTSEISPEESASHLDTLTTQTNTATNEKEVQSSLQPRESAVSININMGVLFLAFVVLFTFGGNYL